MKLQILDCHLLKHRAITHRCSRQLTLNNKNYRIRARGSTLNLLSPRWRNHLKCFARMLSKKSLILTMSCQVGTPLNDSHPSRQVESSPVTSAVASYRRIKMTYRTQLSTNKSDCQNTSFLNYRKNRFNRHRMNSEDFTWQTSY